MQACRQFGAFPHPLLVNRPCSLEVGTGFVQATLVVQYSTQVVQAGGRILMFRTGRFLVDGECLQHQFSRLGKVPLAVEQRREIVDARSSRGMASPSLAFADRQSSAKKIGSFGIGLASMKIAARSVKKRSPVHHAGELLIRPFRYAYKV